MRINRFRGALGPVLRSALLLLAVLVPGILSAQSFGRNKVSYKVIDFSVLTTDHFEIYHYPREAPPVADAAQLLEKWYARHKELLGFGIGHAQRVILYDSFADFQQANAVPGLISAGEGGVTESLGGRIIIPLTGVSMDDDHVLGHELVHAFQFQAIHNAGYGLSRAPSLPLWFMEGMAEYLSLGPDDPLTAMWMRDTLLSGYTPGMGDLASRPDQYFPYRFGEAMWAYIDRRWGHEGVRDFFNEAAVHGVDSAIVSKLHLAKQQEFDELWRNDARATYGPDLKGRALPQTVGRKLTAFGGKTNLGPSISPDGRLVAVFSQVDPFSFSLALVDAASGREVRTLGNTGSDTRFDALHFINATGAWSPDSTHFAFPVDRNGANAIAIAAVPEGRIEKVIPVPRVADISGLAWSPRGDLLALSGTQDAQGGLWMLDLGSREVKRLTTGRGAYLQPSWSPDGDTLAFSTDSGPGTDRAALKFGSMNIGLMDVATGRIEILSIKDGAVHVSPQYAPDGKSIYFVGSPDDVPDIYRYSLETGKFYRVTHVATGISGLTRLSPCLSVSSVTGQLAFTVFSNRDYEVHVMLPTDSQGSEVSFPGAIPLPATIPDSVPSAPPLTARVAPYHPTFELLSASAANIGVSVSSFGAAVGGSAEVVFQDIVGDHLFDVAVQINGNLDTLGGQLFYLNTRRRIAWGVGVAHIPQTVYALLDPSVPLPSGADTGVVQQLRYTELAALQAAYPFSQNRRLEADLTYSHIWWNSSAPVYYFDNGSLVSRDTLSIAVPPALDLIHLGLAYVGDYSFSGFTEPLSGYRYRFDVGGDGGSLYFLTLGADARGYLYLRPFSFAIRGMELGRYLGGADNSALSQLYVGDPGLVRGYEYYSMVSNEGAGGANVPQINRLFGSKIAVVKAEIRLPVIGNGEVGLINFPYVPTTLVGFFDGGMAWTGSEDPVLTWSETSLARIPVFSAGAALRVNLLGAAILEVYFAWPFQRPGVNGSWGFTIQSEGW